MPQDNSNSGDYTPASMIMTPTPTQSRRQQQQRQQLINNVGTKSVFVYQIFITIRA